VKWLKDWVETMTNPIITLTFNNDIAGLLPGLAIFSNTVAVSMISQGKKSLPNYINMPKQLHAPFGDKQNITVQSEF
jgi:hypothetical protein